MVEQDRIISFRTFKKYCNPYKSKVCDWEPLVVRKCVCKTCLVFKGLKRGMVITRRTATL